MGLRVWELGSVISEDNFLWDGFAFLSLLEAVGAIEFSFKKLEISTYHLNFEFNKKKPRNTLQVKKGYYLDPKTLLPNPCTFENVVYFTMSKETCQLIPSFLAHKV